MALAIGLGLGLPYMGGPGGASIALSAATIAEDATNGTSIGNLSVVNPPVGHGVYVFTINSDPDGLFDVSGGALDKNGTLDYEAASSHQVQIKADDSTTPVILQWFTITVTNVAPVLSNATDTKTGQTTATLTVDTTESAGRLYAVVTSGSTQPSDAQIIAGQDNTGAAAPYAVSQAIASSGTKTFSATGFIAATTYAKTWFLHVEPDGTHSNVVSGDGFTTDGSSLLLDSIASLGPVYSFRKLVTAYAGHCATLHESGGNTDQTFDFVGGVIDPASATFGSGTRTVKTWYDQSGNGIDITQTTVGNQPAFIASGINSLPTARFDGANSYLARASVAAADFANSNEWTFLAALKQDGTQTNNIMFIWPFPGPLWVGAFNLGDTLYFDFGSDVDAGAAGRVSIAQPGGWDDAGHIMEGYRTTGNSQALLVDGTSLVSGSRDDAPGSPGTATFYVGTYLSGPYYFKGDFSELIITKNDTGSTNRSTVRKDGVGGGVGQGMGPYFGVTVS